MKKFRIKILQYMFGDLEYFSWSEKINRRYCQLHNYEYVLVDEPPREDRHITWHKIHVILGELQNFDYLLFLDADAFFYSQELTLEEDLIPLMEGRDILMSQDVGCESDRWTPDYPNTGVMLMKVNRDVYEFFRYWNLASDIDESTRWNWPPEQLALWHVVLPAFRDFVKVHSEYYLFQGRYGQYIRHLILVSEEERAIIMKEFCKLRNIF